jgi:hypothetical protein
MMRLWKRISDLVEPWSVHQRRRMRRQGASELSDFIRHFDREPDIARELWIALSREAVVEGYRPHPEDDLLKVYGLADEDLDDLVLGLLERCNCRIPPPSETATMPVVRTVADLFTFLERMRGSGE